MSLLEESQVLYGKSIQNKNTGKTSTPLVPCLSNLLNRFHCVDHSPSRSELG